MLRIAVIACTLALVHTSLSPAFGQRGASRPSRYEPAYGPTLSPYLQFTRPGVGILDNYNNFVRPRVQVRSSIRTQGRQIERLTQELQQAQSASQIRGSGVAPTGIHARYMNYSHFYPKSSSSAGRR